MIQPKDVVLPNSSIPDRVPSQEMQLPTFEGIDLPDFTTSHIGRPSSPPEQTPIDLLNAQLNSDALNQSGNHLYNYSSHEAQKWDRHGGGQYNPYLDMEDAYAKSNPWGTGRVIAKTAHTFWNNLGSSYRMLGAGFLELSKGNWSGFWNNDYAKHLADITLELEELYPMFRTVDERENPLAFRNWTTTIGMFLPALGTVGATIADVAIGHVIATGVGALAGPGGIITANAAALAKDSVALRSAMQGIYSIAKAVQVTGGGRAALTSASALSSAANKARMVNAAKGIASALLFANGEAALQGELNSRKYLEDQNQQHFKIYGAFLTGEALEKAKSDALKVGSLTYALNLPLIAGSQVLQFGNLFFRKSAESAAKSLPVTYKLTDGLLRASAKGVGYSVAKGVALDIASEGGEEFFQSVIDNAVSNYYKPLKEGDKKKNFFSTFAEETLKHGTSQEGVLDFLGGALIGGITSGAKSGKNWATGNNIQRRTRDFVEQFNTTTDRLVDSQLYSQANRERIQKALEKNDFTEVDQIITDEAFNIAQQGVVSGSIDARLQQLDDLKQMDIEEFNRLYSTNMEAEERNVYVDELTKKVSRARDILDDVGLAYQQNPFQRTEWFNNLSERLVQTSGRDKKAISNRLWSDFQMLLAKSAFHSEMLTDTLNNISTKLGNDSYLIDSNLDNAVKSFKRVANQRKVVDDSYEKVLASLEGLTTLEQYTKIVNFLGFDSEMHDTINNGLRAHASMKAAVDHFDRFRDKAGQQKVLTEITEYLEWIYEEESKKSKTVSETPDKAIPEVEELDFPEGTTTAQKKEVVDGLEIPEKRKTEIKEELDNRDRKQKKSDFPDAEPMDAVEYNKLPLKQKLKNFRRGYNLKPSPKTIFVMTTDSGEKIKATQITSSSPRGKDTGAPKATGILFENKDWASTQEYEVSNAVINGTVEEMPLSELSSPELVLLGFDPQIIKGEPSPAKTLEGMYFEQREAQLGKNSEVLKQEQRLHKNGAITYYAIKC